jgi:uncharacterized protein (TIGR00266 family)
MKIEILHERDSAIARIVLDPEEKIMAQAGAMISMSRTMNIRTTSKRNQGFPLKKLTKKDSEESLLINIFQSNKQGGEIYLAPKFMGNIFPCQMTGNELIVQAACFLAAQGSLNISVGFEDLKNRLYPDSLFWLKCRGEGMLFLSGFGGVYEVNVDGEYLVNMGHLVAFDKNLKFEIIKDKSKEISYDRKNKDFIYRFYGEGKLYCQSHNQSFYACLIGSKL